MRAAAADDALIAVACHEEPDLTTAAAATLSASLGAVEAYADASLARSDAEALTALGRSDDLRLRAKGDCLGVVM